MDVYSYELMHILQPTLTEFHCMTAPKLVRCVVWQVIVRAVKSTVLVKPLVLHPEETSSQY